MNLESLSTQEEIAEVRAVGKFSAPNHDPECTRKHLVLRYAFQQKFAGHPPIIMWHVISAGRSHHSTLSMEGLKEWGLL